LLKVQYVEAPPLRAGEERKPLEGEQKAVYTRAAEGLREFDPVLKKEKQLRSC
jgi:hypothetical protein